MSSCRCGWAGAARPSGATPSCASGCSRSSARSWTSASASCSWRVSSSFDWPDPGPRERTGSSRSAGPFRPYEWLQAQDDALVALEADTTADLNELPAMPKRFDRGADLVLAPVYAPGGPGISDLGDFAAYSAVKSP